MTLPTLHSEEPSFPELFNEQTHLFRPGIRQLMVGAKIEIIPEPLRVIGADRERDRLFFQVGVKLF
jgi:hypothetical protein